MYSPPYLSIQIDAKKMIQQIEESNQKQINVILADIKANEWVIEAPRRRKSTIEKELEQLVPCCSGQGHCRSKKN